MQMATLRRPDTSLVGRFRGLIVGLIVGVMVVAVLPALAGHSTQGLDGSNFEIDVDANLKVDDDAPSIDWADVTHTRKDDAPSGQNDDSFGGGTKEDTAVPKVGTGSIPPNKSDLKTFGIFQEQNDDGQFLHMFWTRVQDPEGSTNMDFEFNQNVCTASDDSGCSSNSVTPDRLAGDLLITYDLTKGGTVPVLSLREWDGSAWGGPANLSAAGGATGSINSSTIPAEDADGLDSLDPRTFGEASIDLSVIFDSTECESFGSAYLKSRSSFEFNSALKDFIAPAGVEISNCGSVKITKTDDASPPSLLSGATFTLYVDNDPVGGSLGREDTATTQTCTTGTTGVCAITDVLVGDYWVVETVTPAGHATADPQAVSIVADEQVSLTFVNPRLRGAILVTKTRKHAADGPGDHAHPGVTFSVLQGRTVIDSDSTGRDGKVCFDGLLFGDYTVSETVPTGYAGEDPKSVTVDNVAACADATFVGETVSFSNTPLSDITVSFSPQVVGGTAATIGCTGLTATPADATPRAFDDTSETFEDLLPGTYTCTVVVDP